MLRILAKTHDFKNYHFLVKIFGIFDEKFEQNVLEVANYKQPLIVRGMR